MLTLMTRAFPALLIVTCSCRPDGGAGDALNEDVGVDESDGDGRDDTVDTSPLDTISEVHDPDGEPDLDADVVDDGWDIVSEPCDIPFPDGYDITGLGLVDLPRDRAPRPCGTCCEQVSFSRDRLSQPCSLDAWGRYLVYSTTGLAGKRVVLVDLADRVEYLVAEGLGGSTRDGVAFPAIFEDSLYYGHSWDETDVGHCEIVKFSISTGTREVVHSWEREPYPSGSWCSADLQAHGNYLVWNDNRSGISASQQIRLLDMTTGVETTISGYVVTDSRIWGNRAFYRENGRWIVVHDIPSGTQDYLLDEFHDNWYPSVWEDLITWSDARSGGSYADMSYADIYLMDLVTGVETPVCTHSASQFGSHIYGDLIVWTDLRDDPVSPNLYVGAEDWNIYGYWISRDEEFQITGLPIREWAMELHDKYVFFLMYDTVDVESIFMVYVPPEG